MSKAVIAVFHDRDRAESALEDLKERGFERDISLIAKEGEGDQEGTGDQDLTEGAFTGGALGGIAGLLAGTGALLIPGVGPIIAAGPIAAALTGVVAGGIAGSLVDYGIPEERGEYFEEQVRQGSILVALKADEERVEDAASVLRSHGAEDVETHRAER
jgi:outer membrane lipoprotein SlyB